MAVTKSTIFLLLLLALHTQGWFLNCNFSDVTWTYVGSVYTCTGVLMTSDQNMTSVNGTHLPGRNDSDVQAIALSNQNSGGNLPNNIEGFFPNLVVLSASNLNITQVSRADLEPHGNLRLLILFNNHIETLEADTFVNNTLIEYINLSSNQMRHFGPNIFNPLSNLRTLRLLNNVCIDQYVDNNATEISSFIWSATSSCPPSFEQLEREILNGQNFQSIVSPMLQSIWNLEQRVAQLENGTVT